MVLRRATQRRAFTLTEMMVATALTLFLMAIISAAFRAGLDTFSKLNTANSQQQKLSNIKKIISRDLGADHFEGPYQPGFGGPKLSDQRPNRIGWRPPAKGYFTFVQNASATLEPSSGNSSDGEGLYSTRSESCFFSMSMKSPSTGYADQFSGRLKAIAGQPALRQLPFIIDNTIYSPWAQVHYFVTATGETTDPGPTGTQLPLYALRRQLHVLAPDDESAQVDIPINSITDIKNVRVVNGSVANTVRLVSPTSVQSSRYVDPSNPLTTRTSPIADPDGDDILLVDVLSFEVKVWWDGLVAPAPAPNDTGTTTGADTPKRPILNPPGAGPRYTNSTGTYPAILNSAEALGTPGTLNAVHGIDWPFTELPSDAMTGWGFPRTFDTWFRNIGNEPDWDSLPAIPVVAGGQPPLRIRIKALQIKVRIWDRKTKQARQLTFIQEV